MRSKRYKKIRVGRVGSQILEEGKAGEVHLRPREIAEKITRILTGRSFNFQSKQHLKEIIPQVQNQLLV